MSERENIILKHLAVESYEITTANLFEQMSKSEQRACIDTVATSKALVDLRNKGMVANGESEYIADQIGKGKKTRLTWKITEKGRDKMTGLIQNDFEEHTATQDFDCTPLTDAQIEFECTLAKLRDMYNDRPAPRVIIDKDLKVQYLTQLAAMLSALSPAYSEWVTRVVNEDLSE